jgi:hypothetical protein
VITEKTQRAIPNPKRKTPQEIGTEAQKNTTYHSLSGRNHVLKDPKFRGKKTANRKPYSTDYRNNFQQPKSPEPTTKGRRKRRRRRRRRTKQPQRRSTWEKLCLRIHTVYVLDNIYEVRICARVRYHACTHIYIHIRTYIPTYLPFFFWLSLNNFGVFFFFLNYV